MKLYLATKTGMITAVQTNGKWAVIDRSLDNHVVTSIMAREGVILAGTKNGIFCSEDLGQSWHETSNGLAIRHVRWLAYHPDISDFEFAGTEPASIFVSRNGGASWHERDEVTALRNQFNWWLPYSPEAGCVRGFAFHSSRVYAAVEVGGVLRSDDRGITWQLAEGSNGRPRFGRPEAQLVHPDVHSIVVHPSSPDLIFAPTGGGLYGSDDGGATWATLYDSYCYARAVWVNPGNADHIILGPAESASGRNGRIEETYDGGQTWHRLTDVWSRKMVERFAQVNDTLFAVLSNGQLYSTSLNTPNWHHILPDVKGINALTKMA